MPYTKYRIAREKMVREQIIAKGVKDPLVIEAMLRIPRHEFMPEALKHLAYEDKPVMIGAGQTISQPLVVAQMSEFLELKKGMTVLEVGTGSGYQAAVLHAMGACVFTVERLKDHYFETKKRFERLGIFDIRYNLSDGTLGWAEHAPYDRILVAAGGPTVPEALMQQLADNGILIIPVGEERREQELVRVRREGEKFFYKVLRKVSFVDLVGKQGW